MSAIAALGLTAFLFCLIATPLVRDIFFRAKLVDQPDNDRKFHLKATPRVGGIPIVLSYAASLGLLALVAPHGIGLSVQHSGLLLSLLPATGLIFLTGLIDDLITLRPWQKLVGQSLAAALAVSLGVRMSMHGPAWLAMVVSFVWLIACANALNLIDGMDGLAAGVALFATGSTLLVAVLGGNMGLAVATVPLAGCLFAFLRYNFHPASIFLGDCGSLTIGFMLGCFGLIWSQRTGTMLGMAAPLMALALPLLDVLLAIGRRYLRSVPIFKGDRRHIHHRVLARSVTTRKAVLILYGVCGIASIFALMVSFSGHQIKWVLALLFCVLAIVGVNNLHYIEFTAAKRSLSYRSLLRLIREEIYFRELEHALSEADTVEALWDVTLLACEELSFATLRMRLHGRDFFQATELEGTIQTWRIAVPLGPTGELSMTGTSTSGTLRLMLAVCDSLQLAVNRKEFAGVAEPAFAYRGAA